MNVSNKGKGDLENESAVETSSRHFGNKRLGLRRNLGLHRCHDLLLNMLLRFLGLKKKWIFSGCSDFLIYQGRF